MYIASHPGLPRLLSLAVSKVGKSLGRPGYEATIYIHTSLDPTLRPQLLALQEKRV